MKRVVLVPVLLALGCAGAPRRVETNTVPALPERDRAYFEGVKRTGKLPDDVPVTVLVAELEPWLGSPDHALRDGLAATLIARWVRGGLLPDDVMRAALDRWTRNLGEGIGERETDSVLQRSFSILVLDALAARDLERPFMSEAELHALAEASLSYLEREQDLRGWDAERGWIHATAHTADLLRRLARNPGLCEADQDAIVAGIESKLGSVTQVFTHGENRRLAQVLVALLGRADCRVEPIEAWIGRWRARGETLWNSAFDPELYARVENETQLFRELLAALWTVGADNACAARVREVMLTAR